MLSIPDVFSRALPTGFVVLMALATTQAASADPAAPVAGRATPDEGLVLGASATWLAPGFPHSGGGWSDPPSYGAGPAFGVTVGYRWEWFVLGVTLQHAFLGGGAWSEKTDTVRTLSADSNYGAVDFIAITAPWAPVAAYFHAAVGGRAMRFTTDDGSGGSTYNGDDANLNLLLGIGVQLHAFGLRLVPEADVGAGPLGLYGQLGATVLLDLPTSG